MMSVLGMSEKYASLHKVSGAQEIGFTRCILKVCLMCLALIIAVNESISSNNCSIADVFKAPLKSLKRPS